ncbi:hypothetical protein Tco_0506576 [Tanacetum coccineum]
MGIKQVYHLNRKPKEIFAAESEKFKPPPPMVTPADKRSSNKFCEFHNNKGHSTDECMQLKKQIEELVKAGKRDHLPSVVCQQGNIRSIGHRSRNRRTRDSPHVCGRRLLDGSSLLTLL